MLRLQKVLLMKILKIYQMRLLRILKNNSKRVFICANEKDRLARIEKSYKVDPQKAKEIMEISDKKRENYHTYYTNQDWKDKKNYDLVINTSETGIEKAIEEVIKLAKA